MKNLLSFWDFLRELAHSLFDREYKDTMPTQPIEPTQIQPSVTIEQPAVVGIGDLYPEWDTQKHNWHNVRVLCDRSGLSLEDKNKICACVYQESEFYNYLPGGQPNKHQNIRSNGKVGSTDWGICQINDRFQVGPGLPFSSYQEILQNPQKAVQFMIDMSKAGQLNLWCSYSSGEYVQWLQQGSPMWLLAN